MSSIQSRSIKNNADSANSGSWIRSRLGGVDISLPKILAKSVMLHRRYLEPRLWLTAQQDLHYAEIDPMS